jgi:hypothetical protein
MRLVSDNLATLLTPVLMKWQALTSRSLCAGGLRNGVKLLRVRAYAKRLGYRRV